MICSKPSHISWQYRKRAYQKLCSALNGPISQAVIHLAAVFLWRIDDGAENHRPRRYAGMRRCHLLYNIWTAFRRIAELCAAGDKHRPLRYSIQRRASSPGSSSKKIRIKNLPSSGIKTKRLLEGNFFHISLSWNSKYYIQFSLLDTKYNYIKKQFHFYLIRIYNKIIEKRCRYLETARF